MRKYVENCRDPKTGEVDHTKLAEMVADEMNLYEDADYTIPEEVFEIALEFE